MGPDMMLASAHEGKDVGEKTTFGIIGLVLDIPDFVGQAGAVVASAASGVVHTLCSVPVGVGRGIVWLKQS